VIIGKLRHRVTLQNPTSTRGLDGSNIISFTGTTTVWAQVTINNEVTTEISNKETVTKSITAIVRYSTTTNGLDIKGRLVWEGANYEVTGIVNDERKIYKTITATLIK